MDCSLPGSSTQGIFLARVLEWGAIAFSDDQVTLIYFAQVKTFLFGKNNEIALKLKTELRLSLNSA